MKTLILCLLTLLASSCGNYLLVTLPEGADVHVQGNHVAVLDTSESYRNYYVKDAYKRVNYRGDVYRLLREVNDPVVASQP